MLGNYKEEASPEVVRVALDDLFVVEVGREGRKLPWEAGDVVRGGAAAEFGDGAAVGEAFLGWWG